MFDGIFTNLSPEDLGAWTVPSAMIFFLVVMYSAKLLRRLFSKPQDQFLKKAVLAIMATLTLVTLLSTATFADEPRLNQGPDSVITFVSKDADSMVRAVKEWEKSNPGIIIVRIGEPTPLPMSSNITTPNLKLTICYRLPESRQ